MIKKGKDLIFISRILRDGSGVSKIEPSKYEEQTNHLADTIFVLACLSLTNGTYVASEFNSYVVKLKP